MKNKTIKGYKGFDKDMKCRGLQYEVGKEVKEDNAILCVRGVHFCENPHDVFAYYSAGNGNRFAEVEATDVSEERKDDSKRVAKRLTVKAEISVSNICKIAVSSFFENFGFKKKVESADTYKAGDCGAANAGNCGAANAGDCGAANAGDYGAANAGYYGVASVRTNGRVKGGLGCILVARNVKWNNDKGRFDVTDWAAGIVDGKKIKADTWYKLQDGKLVEVEAENE